MGDNLIKKIFLITKSNILPAADWNHNRYVMGNINSQHYVQIPFLRNAETPTLDRSYQNFVPTEHADALMLGQRNGVDSKKL
jgi:hypothetical protein